MDTKRAMQIYESEQTFKVELDEHSVWIENVDEANGMATVMIGNNPVNTKTVSCDQLKEISK
ncbi:small, acid-soluble spore protein, H family [Paenibacillus sp. FSL H8-0548]|uniref:H-type small acid-soluble spore protein n=1 Tax=Paenibacillus sp. FSL H8-0548 TaxID=1920422 RepID=UPI00096CF04F|nr:H-type small acid-soluble spore protein [Paenibacillus sp. FSL H8-0548]OMF30841.1 small, acid-soluble spore protein, H family [Paenibacillus sp. FSL H8-0548]